MTIPRYEALQRHWRRHPRPEWLIAGYLGYRPQPQAGPLAMLGRSRVVQPALAAPERPRVPPPTGALQMLFRNAGGQPGKTVVLA